MTGQPGFTFPPYIDGWQRIAPPDGLGFSLCATYTTSVSTINARAAVVWFAWNKSRPVPNRSQSALTAESIYTVRPSNSLQRRRLYLRFETRLLRVLDAAEVFKVEETGLNYRLGGRAGNGR